MSLLALMLVGVPLEAQAPPLPVPRTDPSGPALTFDFPGMRVGVAEYDEGPTGTTVFYFPKGVKAAADVRGGSPGTLNADAVRLAYESPMMQSVVFSGGSWYGLSAATGVANELKAMRAEQGQHDATLVVTNQKMPYADLQRLGVQVHTSMARAIQPFATEEDGDVLYAVTTDEVDNSSLPSIQLGAIASELAWDAVLNSAPVLAGASPRTPTTVSAERLAESVGTFAFHGGGTLSVSAGATGLEARFTGDGRMYFAADRTYRLVPIGEDVFVLDGPAEDVIRFDRRAGRIVAITLNPGPWAQSANRGMPR